MSVLREYFYIFLILNLGVEVLSLKRQYLQEKWQVKNANSSITLSATVPGGIYSDLINEGILQDIYYRFNDINYRWVGNETWIYQVNFKVNKSNLNCKDINLVFDGLDTFSTIYLNDKIIGTSDNMFLRYKFDIKSYIKENNNNLTIVFDSPIKISQQLFDRQAIDYTVPPICVPNNYNGECHANFIRKMQASFSWDWGPAFPSVGLWKPVYIEYLNSATIRDITVNSRPFSNTYWLVDLQVFLETNENNINGTITTALTTDIDTIYVFTDVTGVTNDQGEYIQNLIFQFNRLHVDLWWPNGYGEQKLYNLSVTFTSMDEKEKSSKQLKIGFRTIELIQEPIENGLSFYFKVNNISIFAKGSNWIPANILPEKGANSEDVIFLLQSAKDAHMNMLRVWGGGVYESDLFYQTADELGILIWQDFMFACSMYPVNEEFLESVKSEVEQQVRRLQYHPSIAVWAGNNENEAALGGNWYNTHNNFTRYKEDYVKLYVATIRKTCFANDKTRTFVVSSPSNGLESEKEGYVAKNPYDTHFGDVHYYNYLLNGWDQNIYLKTRFASEYGYQSLPSLETLKTATNISSDLKIDSKFLAKRQHHVAGYSQMKLLMIKHLRLPEETKDNYLDTYIYFSQISQAMAIKAETEFYRQLRSTIDENGNGLTMGALYWQLNDVWQAPSWSSIDFKKRWKMLHYFAKKFFHPVLISANVNAARRLTVYVVSDLINTLPNITVTISVYKWDNFKPLYKQNKTLNILPGFSNEITQIWLDQYLVDARCGDLTKAKKRCFIILDLKNMKNEQVGYENFIFPSPLKDTDGLSTPNLLVRVSKTNGLKATNKFNITITTDKIAPFVWLETPKLNGRFSDNGFLLFTKTKYIKYEIEKPITPLELQKSIQITSLLNKEHL